MYAIWQKSGAVPMPKKKKTAVTDHDCEHIEREAADNH